VTSVSSSAETLHEESRQRRHGTGFWQKVSGLLLNEPPAGDHPAPPCTRHDGDVETLPHDADDVLAGMPSDHFAELFDPPTTLASSVGVELPPPGIDGALEPVDLAPPKQFAFAGDRVELEPITVIRREGLRVVPPLHQFEPDDDPAGALEVDLEDPDTDHLDLDDGETVTDGPMESREAASNDDLLAAIRSGRDLRASIADHAANGPTADDEPIALMPPAPVSRDGLDSAIGALRLVAVDDAARHLLPGGAPSVNLAPGIAAAVAVTRGDTPEFVDAKRCERWGITTDMAMSIATSNTPDSADIRIDTVVVQDAETIVLESRLPIAASALSWLDEVVDTALPVGALILLPNPRLMVIQPSRKRSQAVVETLTAFAREEGARSSELISSTMLINGDAGLEVIGQLGSAAGRLGIAAFIDRLTGADI